MTKDPAGDGPRVGIALGGGGAKGLAHIVMLEALDELGIRPHRIAGTSIGSIIGAVYADGKTGAQIRDAIDDLVRMPKSLEEAFEAKRLFGWFDLIDIDIGRSSVLQVDKFLDGLDEGIEADTIEDLQIPMKIVATDFWARQAVVFEDGPIIPAIAASFALPGIFKPVVMDDRVLIDGGSVNPVPFDLLGDDCDITIAIDVMGKKNPPGDDLLPGYVDTLFNTFQIAEKAIVDAKLLSSRPDIYIDLDIADVRVLEFNRYEEIYAQAEPARDRLVDALKSRLGA